MVELKPCPFCGGRARLFVKDGVRVVCTRCYVSTRVLRDELEYCPNCGAKMDGGESDEGD